MFGQVGTAADCRGAASHAGVRGGPASAASPGSAGRGEAGRAVSRTHPPSPTPEVQRQKESRKELSDTLS